MLFRSDFLRLRADCGEIDAELGAWWAEFSLADDTERERLMDAARKREPARRQHAPALASGVDEPADADSEVPTVDEPARRRRRRRRKPADGGAAAAPAGNVVD